MDSDPLQPADQHRLRAVEGWLELGNEAEAKAELEQISPEALLHPDVVYARWQIYRKTQSWQACFEVARSFTQLAPDDPRGWTCLAQTLYYTSRHQDAYDLAISKITTFPRHWPLYYDAACYACLTGRLNQARQFLQLAAALGDEAEVKHLATSDPDFEALRKDNQD